MKEIPFSPELLTRSSSKVYRDDSDGGYYSANITLYVLWADGKLQELNTPLEDIPMWQSSRFLIISTEWETKTYWQQQRDGNLDGYDYSSGLSSQFIRIPVRPNDYGITESLC
jgi:hypothetical protein